MRSEPVAELGRHLAGLCEDFGSERCQFVSGFPVTGKRKHVGAESHELDTVPLVPSEHLDNVARISKPQTLDVLPPQTSVGFLRPVGPVLGAVLGL